MGNAIIQKQISRNKKELAKLQSKNKKSFRDKINIRRLKFEIKDDSRLLKKVS